MNLRITKSSKTEGLDRQVNYYVFSLSGVSDWSFEQAFALNRWYLLRKFNRSRKLNIAIPITYDILSSYFFSFCAIDTLLLK